MFTSFDIRKNIIKIISFLLLIFFAPLVITGQSYITFREQMEQVEQNVRYNFGPLKLFPAIRFNDVGYDSNVYYMREGDDPISDYTFTFSPQITAYMFYRKWLIFSIIENPEYVFFYEQEGERRWNNNLPMNLKLLVLNRFVISGDYLNRNRRYRVTSEFNVRANERIIRYGGRFFYETARSTSFGISTTIIDYRYEDVTQPGEEISLSRELNRKEINNQLEFYYRISNDTTFFLRAGHTDYDFMHPESFFKNSNSFQAFSGVQFPLLGRIRGILSIGYKWWIPKQEEREEFSGFVGNTTLDFRTNRFRFRVFYSNDIKFSYRSTYFLESVYGLGVSYYVAQFLRVDYDFSYGLNSYSDEMQVLIPDGEYETIKREDVYRTHSIGVVFRTVRNTGLGITVNFRTKNSNYPGDYRERILVGGYLTYDF